MGASISATAKAYRAGQSYLLPDLETAEMTLLENFPHKCTFSRRSHTRSDIGGQRIVPTAFATGKSCWLQSANHSDIERFASRDITVTHTLLVAPTDAALLAIGDRVTITSGPSHVNDVVEVKSVGERTSGLNWMSTAMVELIK